MIFLDLVPKAKVGQHCTGSGPRFSREKKVVQQLCKGEALKREAGGKPPPQGIQLC